MSARKSVRKSDCAGCKNNFYNQVDMGFNKDSGKPECWSFKTAAMVKARDIPVDLRPPYLHIKETSRPDCYKANRVYRVSASRLDAKGFWK